MNRRLVLSPTMQRNGWTPGAMVATVLLAMAAVVLTLDAWRDILRLAVRDEESSHIFLVPIVVAWLFWVRRSRLKHCRRVGTWIGPIIAFAGAVLFIAGDTYLIQSFWHGGALLLLVGACLTIWGRDVLLAFLPVFAALVFLIPVPGRLRQQIAIPLQQASAWATEQVYELAGVALERSGNLLSINGTDVAVAEACNGMRMTFALLLVCYVFAFSTPLKGYVRVLLILLSPVAAVVCNVIRLVPTVYVYGNWTPDMAELFHDLSGWVMLFVAFFMLMSVIRVLRWAAVPVTTFTLARD